MTEKTGPTVIHRLAEFIYSYKDGSLPTETIAQAKRLLLNGLRASLSSYDQPTITVLAQRAGTVTDGVDGARVLWLGQRTRSEEAALISAAQWFYSLADDCHLPTGTHPTAPAAAAALAQADVHGCTGAEVLSAIVLGVEIELALSTAMMPGLRLNRGFAPVITSSVAAATAASVVQGLGRDEVAQALGMAMLTQVGLWEMAGTPSSYYTFGENARAGVVAAQLAGLGLTCPDSIFEGGHGALRAYSGESMEKVDESLGQLGSRWRIMESSCQQFAADTVTQAPLECILDVRSRVAESQLDGAEITLYIDPLTVHTAEYRREKFGRPHNPVEAQSDPMYCWAVGWFTGRLSAEERGEPYLSDPRILQLRDRFILKSVGEPEGRQYQRARVEVRLADGKTETANVETFVGHWQKPFSDADLERLFREAAAGRLESKRAESILAAMRSFEARDDARELTALLVAQKTGPAVLE